MRWGPEESVRFSGARLGVTHQGDSLAQGHPGAGQFLSEKRGTEVQPRAQILITLFTQDLQGRASVVSQGGRDGS